MKQFLIDFGGLWGLILEGLGLLLRLEIELLGVLEGFEKKSNFVAKVERETLSKILPDPRCWRQG